MERSLAPGHVAFELLPPRPNPTAGGLTIEFVLPEAAEVRADIVDVAGRRVTSLTAGERFAAGRQTLRWNGNGASTVRVRPGVYLVRLRAGNATRVRKVVLEQ